MDDNLRLIVVAKQPRSVLPTTENITAILLSATCFITESGRYYVVAKMLPPKWKQNQPDMIFVFIDSKGFERDIPRTLVARVQLRS